jgi:acyl-coenzyme A thioesterase PaaI-like protein
LDEDETQTSAMSTDRNRAKQPNSRHCFVCGVENPVGLHLAFYNTDANQVVAEVTIPDAYQGYPGVVHGGIVASMLDEAAARAAMGEDIWRLMVTARLSIRYRKPVPIGQPLRLVGRLERRRGRLANAHSEIQLPDGTVGAEAEALLADVPTPPGEMPDMDSLGWKVYPD